MPVKPESQVLFASVKHSPGAPFHLECRFKNGQKFDAVLVDGRFPLLAQHLADALTPQVRHPLPVPSPGHRRADTWVFWVCMACFAAGMLVEGLRDVS